jgi:hypothetical protein
MNKSYLLQLKWNLSIRANSLQIVNELIRVRVSGYVLAMFGFQQCKLAFNDVLALFNVLKTASNEEHQPHNHV